MSLPKTKYMMMALVAVASLTMFTGTSRADLLSGCGDCQGSTYLLQYNPTPVGTFAGGGKIWDVLLTINPTGYNGGGSYIHAVSIKVASSDDISQSSLVAAPGGAGSWTLHNGGLNAGGCDGNGGGFECASDAHAAPVPFAGTYKWEFHYATTDSLLLGPLGSSIKAEYVNSDGRKVGALVSDYIQLQGADTQSQSFGEVPEPTSLALLLGIVALTARAIRRRLV
jgi:hypothetical protein